MPLFFWGDEDGSRYRATYFEHYPGVWRHGDWIEITSRGTAVIYGRSDSTINRGGVRMGTSEIYRAVQGDRPRCTDALVVDVPRPGTEGWMPLFVVLARGRGARRRARRARSSAGSASGARRATSRTRSSRSPRCRARSSGKVLEVPVKRILMGTPRRAGREPRLARQPGVARLLRRAASELDSERSEGLAGAACSPPPRRTTSRRRLGAGCALPIRTARRRPVASTTDASAAYDEPGVELAERKLGRVEPHQREVGGLAGRERSPPSSRERCPSRSPRLPRSPRPDRPRRLLQQRERLASPSTSSELFDPAPSVPSRPRRRRSPASS